MTSEREQTTEPNAIRSEMLKIPLDRVWSATVGLEVTADDEEAIIGRLPITESLCQPMGLVHGGIYACIGEELASVGTGRAVTRDGKWCVGQSNLTHFFRSGTLGGTLHGVARPIHRGRTTWVWDVEIRNDDGKLCARSTVTMAVREGTPPGP